MIKPNQIKHNSYHKGEFGEVLLAEAPISAFPDDSLNLDLPKDTKDCLVALKRPKPESSAKTNEKFLGKWFKGSNSQIKLQSRARNFHAHNFS